MSLTQRGAYLQLQLLIMFPVCVTVFGKVVDGMDVVRYIEKVPKGYGDRPVEAATIKASGELPVAEHVRDEL